MSTEQLTSLVVESLCEVAPDLRGIELALDADIRREYDLDSVDFLAFVQRVHKKTGSDIPDADFNRFASIAGAVRYLASASSGSS